MGKRHLLSSLTVFLNQLTSSLRFCRIGNISWPCELAWICELEIIEFWTLAWPALVGDEWTRDCGFMPYEAMAFVLAAPCCCWLVTGVCWDRDDCKLEVCRLEAWRRPDWLINCWWANSLKNILLNSVFNHQKVYLKKNHKFWRVMSLNIVY